MVFKKILRKKRAEIFAALFKFNKLSAFVGFSGAS